MFETKPTVKKAFDAEVDPFLCIICKKAFDSMIGRMPYSLPCQHNVCMDCVLEGINSEQGELVCPIEGAFLNRIEEAVYNKELFQLVKTKERELVQNSNS
jgi:hypothetical protein